MTKEEKEKEELIGSDIVLLFHKKYSSTDLVTLPTFDPSYAIVPYSEETKIVNSRREQQHFSG